MSGQALFLVVFCVVFRVLSSAPLSSVFSLWSSLSFSFLSERFLSSMLKLLLRILEINKTQVSLVSFYLPQMTLGMRVGHVIPPTHFGHDRYTDRHIYHAKSWLNTRVSSTGGCRGEASPPNPQSSPLNYLHASTKYLQKWVWSRIPRSSSPQTKNPRWNPEHPNVGLASLTQIYTCLSQLFSRSGSQAYWCLVWPP